MDELYDAFELDDPRTLVTLSLHSNDPVRRIEWWFIEPKDIDLLYYTQKLISPEEKARIEEALKGTQESVNRILSLYI